MNFSKHSFTPEQFLALSVHESGWDAPVETPFLLKGKMSSQQDYVKEMIEELGIEAISKQLQEQKKLGKPGYFKIQFWWKYKDGHVQDRGGHISFDAGEKIIVKDDKLIFNLGDDVKFDHIKYDDGRIIDEPKPSSPIGG